MTDNLADDVALVAGIDVIPKMLEVICRTTGMGFSAIARVTEDRWIACAVRDEIEFGLKPGGELEIKTTICDEIRGHQRPVVIDHVAEDPLFRDHHTPRRYGFQSYISVPIIHRGQFFGTLCAIDPQPAKLDNPQIRGVFELFADLMAFHLDAQDRLARSEAALLDERAGAELREQFIAVLGHDLRNPLASIDGAARLLRKTPLNERAGILVDAIEKSVGRMAGLIDNVLDFARGRLGGGFVIERRLDGDLLPTLEQVVAELRLAQPGRTIDVDLRIDRPVAVDTRRLGQLLSNLLGNALTHGAKDAPIQVAGRLEGGQFELWVANRGDPIPPAAMTKLFQPFSRASVQAHQQGLGLGLYISAEIARAHGGELSVSSDVDETRFTLRMPLSH